MIENTVQEFSANWYLLLAQVINFIIILGLFILAARLILIRGKGWEVPIWLILAFFIPVICPIIAIINFRKSKYDVASTQIQKV